MNMKNSQIRAHSRYLLDDNIFGKDWMKAAITHLLIDGFIAWFSYILVSLSYIALVVIAFSSIQSLVLRLILAFLFCLLPLAMLYALIGPISVGVAAVYMDLVNGERVRIRKFFHGFRHFFSNAIIGVMYILQVAIWSLFFIIPGIYVAYTYALVFHVKRDHPEYYWKQCFDESERLMEGNRWNLFKLQVSHLGWLIIGFAFLFIGSYWAIPYMNTSTAIFYEEVKEEKSY